MLFPAIFTAMLVISSAKAGPDDPKVISWEASRKENKHAVYLQRGTKSERPAFVVLGGPFLAVYTVLSQNVL